MAGGSQSSAPGGAAAAADWALAFRNAFKLSVSLLATWGIAFGVRLVLPRFLGPEAFGNLTFADAFSATFFVALTLGVESHILRKVSVESAHASDFVGTVFLLRIVLAAALVLPMALVLHSTGRSPEVQRLVWAFSVANLLVASNATFASVLQARGRVDGLSVLNVGSKIVWAAGIGAAIVFRAPLWAFVAPLVVSEALKAPALGWLAGRHCGLALRVDLRATASVLLQSAPFYANGVALAVFAKLDYTLLAVSAPASEVGYYGASATLAAVALLAIPLFGSVLYPLLARAASRSEEEMNALLRRVLELVIAVALPVSLAAALGAELWMGAVFGAAFVPAALPMTVLAPTLLLTYVNSASAMALSVTGRAWRVVAVTCGGIAIDAAVNLLLIRPTMAWLARPGAGAMACAAAMLVTETCVCAAMLHAMGRHAFDRRSLSRLARSGVAAAAAVVAGVAAAPLGVGPRVALAGAVYLAAALALGAVRLEDVAALRDLARRPSAGPLAAEGSSAVPLTPIPPGT